MLTSWAALTQRMLRLSVGTLSWVQPFGVPPAPNGSIWTPESALGKHITHLLLPHHTSLIATAFCFWTFLSTGLCSFLSETLHKNAFSPELSGTKQLPAAQEHTHGLICSFIVLTAYEEGTSWSSWNTWWWSHFEAWLVFCFLGFFTLKVKPSSSCLQASSTSWGCLLGLKLWGPRGIKTFPSELCFCILKFLLHFLSPPQPPGFQTGCGKEILPDLNIPCKMGMCPTTFCVWVGLQLKLAFVTVNSCWLLKIYHSDC